jgi:adenosine deaminase
MAIKNLQFWRRFIIGMPKVEIHLHLEGAFTLSTLLTLIRKYGGDASIQTIDDLRDRFVYRDFAQFIDAWIWKNQFFRHGEDFELSAYQTLLDLHSQNVLHIEAFFSPWDFMDNGIGMEEITESLIAGCERAKRECGIGWGLIADINREHGPDVGMHRIDQICQFQDRGVIGVGLGGREAEYAADAYDQVYAEAARRGLLLTAHAGEAAGPESMWAVLDTLHVHRIGHGVRAQEDLNLVETLRQRQVPLEMCLTSNVRTGVVPTFGEHPIRRYLLSGLKVTLNTDDPTMFGCSLTGEYLMLLEKLGWEIEEIRALAMNAVDALALDPVAKDDIRRRCESDWNRAFAEACEVMP